MTCAPELISCSNQKLFREAYCRRDENLIRKIQSIRELVEEGKAGGAAAYIPLLRSLGMILRDSRYKYRAPTERRRRQIELASEMMAFGFFFV
jgi:hypothetical protein